MRFFQFHLEKFQDSTCVARVNAKTFLSSGKFNLFKEINEINNFIISHAFLFSWFKKS